MRRGTFISTHCVYQSPRRLWQCRHSISLHFHASFCVLILCERVHIHIQWPPHDAYWQFIHHQIDWKWLRNLWRLRISWINLFGIPRCSLSNQTNASTAQYAFGHTVQCLYLNECEWVMSVWVSPFMGTDCVMTALSFCGALSSEPSCI